MNVNGARQFVDANVLIYAHDTSAGEKHERAAELVRSLWESPERSSRPPAIQQRLRLVEDPLRGNLLAIRLKQDKRTDIARSTGPIGNVNGVHSPYFCARRKLTKRLEQVQAHVVTGCQFQDSLTIKPSWRPINVLLRRASKSGLARKDLSNAIDGAGTSSCEKRLT